MVVLSLFCLGTLGERRGNHTTDGVYAVILAQARTHVDVEQRSKWIPDHLRYRASGMTA
jgi:hypothetical protein